MTTRVDICRDCPRATLTDGQPVMCALITCCNDPDTPSMADFRRRLSHPRAVCPHPDGDKWQGITLPVLQPGETMEPASTTPARPLTQLQLAIAERVYCCKGRGRGRPPCALHYTRADAPWGCMLLASNDVRPQIKDTSYEFPDGCLIARVEGGRP